MMAGKVDGVILDVDGTLWDSTEIVAQAWTQAVHDGGGGNITVTADMLKGLFGKTMMVIADCMLPQLPPEKRYAIMDLCCQYEHEALQQDPCHICYPGVKETIREISERVPVFIVSNCQSGYIELFLEKTELGAYIQDTECFGNTGKSKGENIRLLVSRNKLQSPIYIGDTQGDCDASKDAGVPFIFASYGFGSADTMSGQIESFYELKKFVTDDSEQY